MSTIYRNACPRNCYSTCTILSHVENNQLIKVEGDEKNGYTKGSLCAKGYAYTNYVYSPYRIKYPLKQVPRSSGNWVRITWEEAYHTIAKKIISLYKKNNSNLGIGYNKFSGNLGMLHYAVEAMFNSFGPHTKCVGNPCNSSGEKAIKDILGEHLHITPEKMSENDCIIIWGANPCITNIHQMKYIFDAQEKGAKLVVIDPLFTNTADHADIYIQINPKTDYLLAIGIIKWLITYTVIDFNLANQVIDGIDEFLSIVENYSFEEITQTTKVSIEAIELLATTLLHSKNPATWIGFGLQRYENGEQIVATICNLTVLINSTKIEGGSIYYSNNSHTNFYNHLLNFPEKKHETIKQSREVLLNNFAYEALSLDDPPLELLWIASRNPLSQDSNIDLWKQLMNQLDLIVVVDLFMNETTKLADLVLPATTPFEEEDLNVSYWNNWLTYNQKAIPNFYEAKSDLQIARELTNYLNILEPNFSTFLSELEPKDWIKKELTNEIMKNYAFTSLEELEEGPKKYVGSTNTNSKKIKLSTNYLKSAFNIDDSTYTLLTPQSLLKIHSQYKWMHWLTQLENEEMVEISPIVARKEQLVEGDKIKLINESKEILAKVKINEDLPPTVILYFQAGEKLVNELIVQKKQDVKKQSSFFYDVKVRLQKVGMNHVL